MRIKIFYLVLVVGLFTACINMNDPRDQAEYINCYNSFDTSLVDIIPKKIPNSYINLGFVSFEYMDESGDYAGMHITTKISDSKEFSELKDKYLRQAKSINNSFDSCLIVVGTYGRLEHGVQGDFTCDKPVPVPQYGICDANDSTHLWERIKDTEIIVLDYKFEDLLNRSDSQKRNDMPDGLSFGYSKGITMSKKDMTIQKWLIVW